MPLDVNDPGTEIEWYAPHQFTFQSCRRAAGCTRGRDGRRKFEYVESAAGELLVGILLQVTAIVILEDGHRADSNPLACIVVCRCLAVPSLRLGHDQRRIGKRRPVDFDLSQALLPHELPDLG